LISNSMIGKSALAHRSIFHTLVVVICPIVKQKKQ
jgi:hypothetical protein